MSKIIVDQDGNENIFPDDFTEGQIAQALDMTAVRPHVRRKRKQKGGLQQVADLLPAVGGTVGGIVGGAGGTAFGLGFGGVPGAIGGAGLGGAGGEAARQLIYQAAGIEGAPTSSSEAAHRIIEEEGAGQGLLEATGLGLASGALRTGRALMRVGLRATPEVAKTAIAHGIAASRRGLSKAKEEIFKQSAITNRHLAKAEARGVEFQPFHIALNALALLRPQLIGRFRKEEAEEAAALAMRFLESEGTDAAMTPLRLNQIKRSMAEAASPIRKAIERNEQITVGQKVDAMFSKAFEDAADQALTDAVPGYHASNLMTSELIKVKNAINRLKPERIPSVGVRIAQRAGAPAVGGAAAAAVFPEGSRLKGAAYGAGLGAAGAAFASPSALTRTALFVSDPALSWALRYAPRTLVQASRE